MVDVGETVTNDLCWVHATCCEVVIRFLRLPIVSQSLWRPGLSRGQHSAVEQSVLEQSEVEHSAVEQSGSQVSS